MTKSQFQIKPKVQMTKQQLQTVKDELGNAYFKFRLVHEIRGILRKEFKKPSNLKNSSRRIYVHEFLIQVIESFSHSYQVTLWRLLECKDAKPNKISISRDFGEIFLPIVKTLKRVRHNYLAHLNKNVAEDVNKFLKNNPGSFKEYEALFKKSFALIKLNNRDWIKKEARICSIDVINKLFK